MMRDKEFYVHKTQLKRVDSLIKTVKENLYHSRNMSIWFWYLCHITAFMGWVAGLSIAGTSLNGSVLDKYLSAFLGLCASIYPLAKYYNLEEKRKEYNLMVLFCIEIEEKLEDTSSIMKGILSDGKVGMDEREQFDTLVNFISHMSITMNKMAIGDRSFQKILDDFEIKGSVSFKGDTPPDSDEEEKD